MKSAPAPSPIRSRLPYVACALAVIAVGVSGGLFRPDTWFAALSKPNWNPPNWVFAPVWTVLYVMIAIAGGQVFASNQDIWPSRLFWTAQLILNGLWSFLFFGRHRIDLALIDILLLLGTIGAFVITTWPKDRTAALLFVPYFFWVLFATALNATLWTLNTG